MNFIYIFVVAKYFDGAELSAESQKYAIRRLWPKETNRALNRNYGYITRNSYNGISPGRKYFCGRG